MSDPVPGVLPGLTVVVPAPEGNTEFDTPNIAGAISNLTGALAYGPATMHFQDGFYELDGPAGVIQSMSNFTVTSNGGTVIGMAPNRSGLPNNVTYDVFVIADCTDFSVTNLTFDGQRDLFAPITPISAAISSGQPSVTVAAGASASFHVGQYLILTGGLGSAEQNQNQGLGVGKGSPLVIKTILPGSGSGGGDLITFTANIADSYAVISSTLISDGIGPYSCEGAYLSYYQTGLNNSVAGRTLSGEDQQCGLHLLNCSDFTIANNVARNVWESPFKCGTGYTSSVFTDGCSNGVFTGNRGYHGYDQGISLWNCINIAASGNYLNAAGWAGISMSCWTDLCSITGNQILNCVYLPNAVASGTGVAIEGGRGNSVVGNSINGCYRAGVLLWGSPFVTALSSTNSPTTSTFLPTATAGGTSIQVSATSELEVGLPVSIIDGENTEALTVASIIDSTHVTFVEQLRYSHGSGVYVNPRTCEDNIVTGNTIENLTTGPGIDCGAGVRSIITGNMLKDFGTGFGIDSSVAHGPPTGVHLGANGSRIEDNVVTNTGGGGCMKFAYGTGLTVRGNYCTDSYSTGSNTVVSISEVTDSNISHNRIYGCGLGAATGMNIGNGTGPVSRITAHGNVIQYTGAEGFIVIGATQMTISDNVVTSCGGTGGISLKGVQYSTIANNQCISNQNDGIVLNDSGSTYCLYNRVTGNTTRDDATGMNYSTGVTWTQQHGIVEAGNSNNNLFMGNETDSNHTDQLTTVGAGSVTHYNIISGTIST